MSWQRLMGGQKGKIDDLTPQDRQNVKVFTGKTAGWVAVCQPGGEMPSVLKIQFLCQALGIKRVLKAPQSLIPAMKREDLQKLKLIHCRTRWPSGHRWKGQRPRYRAS